MAVHDNTIETMALGRPFGLGMLYDYRSDKLIPAKTLWDPDVLKTNCVTTTQPFTSYTIKTEDSLHDKADLLAIKGSLKLSILSGLVDVSGSAKYANDVNMTKHEERVTLKYSTTVRFTQLSMNHLGAQRMDHTDVLDQDIATHVVTGIVYGADAFFVFNRKLSENEENTKVHGKLEALLYKLPKIDASTNIKLNMNNDEKQIAESLMCKFYGDFNLEQNPSTFEEAVKIYKALPSLLGKNRENVVAKIVYLFPLRSLNRPNMKIVRDISKNLIDQSVSLINDWNELQIQADDLIKYGNPAVHRSKRHLELFIDYIKRFENDAKQKMIELLMGIRGAGVEEAQLADYLNKIRSSPFNQRRLFDWIESKKREIVMKGNFMRPFTRNEKVDLSSYALDNAISDIQSVFILCLSIHLTSNDEYYLQELCRYLDTGTVDESKKATQISWTDREEVLAAFREKLQRFLELVQANADNQQIKFVISDRYINEEKNLEGVFLNLYENSRKKDFEIPSKPDPPIVTEIKHDCILLTWRKSHHERSNAKQYKIICTKENDNEWRLVLPVTDDSESILVESLTSNTVYTFKVQILTTIGIVIESDASDRIVTKPQGEDGFFFSIP